MASKQLYAFVIPENAEIQSRSETQRNVAKLGNVAGGVSGAESLSVDPGDEVLQGYYRLKYADVYANGIEELFNAPDIHSVPLFSPTSQTDRAGYYTLSNIDLRRPVPEAPEVVSRFDGVLSEIGTKKSHFRAVRLRPDTVTNPFGSASTETLWLSSRATEVQWWAEDGSLESATVQDTQPGEFGDFDKYDATEPSFSDDETYHIVYSIPYEWEQKSDVRVWDDHNRSKVQVLDEGSAGATVGTDTVGSATVGGSGKREVPASWQRVYSPSHDYNGKRVLESHRIRLIPDEDRGVLEAYRWDDRDETYGIVQLGQSDWRLTEFDIRNIGLGRIRFLAKFEDTSSLGTTYSLAADLKRGWNDVHFWEPSFESGSTPAGLVTRLDPIAAESDQELGETTVLAKRGTVKNS